MDFVIGGLAGAGATIFTNPMDVVKTRLQLQGELRARSETSTRYRGIFHALYVIAKADGALALQKGLIPAMVLGFTMNSVSQPAKMTPLCLMESSQWSPRVLDTILTARAMQYGDQHYDGHMRLGMYHVAEVHGWTKNKNGDISIEKAIFWASASGVMSAVTGNPASVVKTRIQAAAHPSIAVGRQHKYNGMCDGVTKIYKSEGIKGFFAGVSATCARLAIGSAAQLTTFSKFKESLRARGYFENSPVALSLVGSIVCGVIVVIVETPLDVINTRIYNQGAAVQGKVLYTGVFDCLTKIYKTEGVYGLYKGIGPLYLRIAPHTTLSLVIWDVLNNLLLSNKNS